MKISKWETQKLLNAYYLISPIHFLLLLLKKKEKKALDIVNPTSATNPETFCFTSLVDINKALQAGVGGYSFLLKREQNLQQGAAGDKDWREENQKVLHG